MEFSDRKRLVPPNIEELKPYVPGKTIAEVQKDYKPERISKLASNENRLGHSAVVDKAVGEALKIVHDYPDALALNLRTALAEELNVGIENLVVASGSESVLAAICRTFFLNNENLITADATFIGMYVQAKVRGIKLKKIPLTSDYRFDLKGIVNAIDERTKVIYIANPNNPTGTFINSQEFEWLMEQVPSDILVIMDEAYYEFATEHPEYPDVLKYNHDNVIILRTFSKVYGLAGFRVGYGIGHEKLIHYLLKTKLPFEPGTVAQAAALAALGDKEFVKESYSIVKKGREELYDFFDQQKVKYIKSVANFVTMILPDEESAIWLTEEMLKKGVILRRLNAFGLPNCIRVTIGLPKEMEHFKSTYLELSK